MKTCERSVCELYLDDIEDVTRVHAAAFPRSALTQLGNEAVGRYYRSLLLGPHRIDAFGARINGDLAGFCFGGIAPAAMPAFLRQNVGLLSRRLLLQPWLVADPMFRDRIKRSFSAFRRGHAPSYPDALPQADRRPYDILSIAVDPRWQRRGIGKVLMEHARATASRNGYYAMTLMVNTDNEQATGFYESLGWKKHCKSGQWRGNMELWF